MSPNDPTLLEAIEKIRKICVEYDCMASLILVSPTHAEVANVIQEPSWSVLGFDREGDGKPRVGFKNLVSEFGSFVHADGTLKSLLATRDILQTQFSLYELLAVELEKAMAIDNTAPTNQ